MKPRSESGWAECLAVGEKLLPNVVRAAAHQHIASGGLLTRPLSFEDLREAWASVGERVRRGSPETLSLYVHIPFCRQRCRYCIYYTLGGAPAAVVAAYLRRLHDEIDFFAPALRGARFTSWYVGGGTPTLLDPKSLREVLAHVSEAFPAERPASLEFETHPVTTTEEHVQAFMDFGFTRASFGMQSASPRVLRAASRGYQHLRDVRRSLDMLRSRGLLTNVDLLYGLPGGGPVETRASLEVLLALRPAMVTVNALSSATPAMPGLPAAKAMLSLEELAGFVKPVADRAGYGVSRFPTCLTLYDLGSEHAHAPMPARGYSDIPEGPASVLALGPSTRSRVYGRLRYREDTVPPDAPLRTRGPGAVGRSTTLRDEEMLWLVSRLCAEGAFTEDGFAGVFGKPLPAWARGRLDEMSRQGHLRRGDSGRWEHLHPDPARRIATEIHLMGRAALRTYEVVSRLMTAQEGGRIGGAGGEPKPGREALRVTDGRDALAIVVTDDPTQDMFVARQGAFSFFLPPFKGNLGEERAALLERIGRVFVRAAEDPRARTLADLVRVLEESCPPGLRVDRDGGRGGAGQFGG